ncbi:MAG: ATP-binding protein [Ignavibacteria bacterium]|nr:ATP-binding protein [Ignavibacteria bacterium]
MEKISNDWYQIFFEEANDAIIVVDAETWKLLAANRYAKKLLGITNDNFHDISFPQFRRIVKLARKENSPTVFSELYLDSEVYGEVLIEVHAKLTEFEGKKIIIATCRNTVDQYLMTEKLVQTDKLVLLGQLSASLVHEIRNPLAAVNLNLQLLQRNISVSSDLFTYINNALQGVERISRIIDVTLSFSRATPTQEERIKVNELIAKTIELLNHLFKKKNVRLNLNLQNDLPEISADSKQLQQILINLITNAYDAIDELGCISIKTFTEEDPETEGKFVCVTIEDNGVGISEEDLSKIFNPFFTKKPHGTGLGLSITQKLLYQYNGTIEISSQVGVGTKITTKFPQIV